MRILPIIAGFAAATLITMGADHFLFESMLVPSSSMRPTLLPNERIYLKKFNFLPIKRFAVVVIDEPRLSSRIVKRVIGLPGECVELNDSFRVRVNGREFTYGSVQSRYSGHAYAEVDPGTGDSHLIQLERNPKFSFDTKYGQAPYCLGPDEYYVLGDNRLASLDSRVIGAVNLKQIQGLMTRIWYSYDLKADSLRSERIGMKVK